MKWAVVEPRQVACKPNGKGAIFRFTAQGRSKDTENHELILTREVTAVCRLENGRIVDIMLLGEMGNDFRIRELTEDYHPFSSGRSSAESHCSFRVVYRTVENTLKSLLAS